MKDVIGFEGLYSVTSCGRIWSYKSNKFLKPNDNGCGYLQVTLYKDGKRYNRLVHRLVVEAYLDNSDNLPEVNHKDEVKSHNWINNLEYCDRKYNINFGTGIERGAEARSKALLNDPKHSHRIRCIETGEEFPSLMECQRKLGCSSGNLSEHLRGKRKHVNGYTFERI